MTAHLSDCFLREREGKEGREAKIKSKFYLRRYRQSKELEDPSPADSVYHVQLVSLHLHERE